MATDDYVLADNFAKLTGIAPTLSYLEGPEADTWQQRTAHIGRALGRERQEQQAIDDVEALVQRTARANPGFAGRTFSRGYVDGVQIRAITGDVSQTLFEQLGLRLAPAFAALPQGDTPGRSVVSPENLGVFEAEVMLVSYISDDDVGFLESNPVFQQLNVVRDGGYIRTELEYRRRWPSHRCCPSPTASSAPWRRSPPFWADRLDDRCRRARWQSARR